MNATAVRFPLSACFALLFLAFSGPFDQSAAAQGGKGGMSVPVFVPQTPPPSAPPFNGMPGVDWNRDTVKSNEELNQRMAKSHELAVNVMKDTTAGPRKALGYVYYAALGFVALILVVGVPLVLLKLRRAPSNPRDLAMSDPWLRAQLEAQNSAK